MYLEKFFKRIEIKLLITSHEFSFVIERNHITFWNCIFFYFLYILVMIKREVKNAVFGKIVFRCYRIVIVITVIW